MPMAPTSKKGAELLKLEGNACYVKGRYAAAIESYTQAITLCPDIAVLWTNRALCHRKRNEWAKVEDDCRKAIQLDHNSVKGHYMLGLALLQKEDYAEGVRQLEKMDDKEEIQEDPFLLKILGKSCFYDVHMLPVYWKMEHPAK